MLCHLWPQLHPPHIPGLKLTMQCSQSFSVNLFKFSQECGDQVRALFYQSWLNIAPKQAILVCKKYPSLGGKRRVWIDAPGLNAGVCTGTHRYQWAQCALTASETITPPPPACAAKTMHPFMLCTRDSISFFSPNMSLIQLGRICWYWVLIQYQGCLFP